MVPNKSGGQIRRAICIKRDLVDVSIVAQQRRYIVLCPGLAKARLALWACTVCAPYPIGEKDAKDCQSQHDVSGIRLDLSEERGGQGTASGDIPIKRDDGIEPRFSVKAGDCGQFEIVGCNPRHPVEAMEDADKRVWRPKVDKPCPTKNPKELVPAPSSPVDSLWSLEEEKGSTEDQGRENLGKDGFGRIDDYAAER